MGVEYRYDKDTNEKVVRLDTDYTTGRATNLDNLDQAISTTESNIRGVDNDTLKTLSDQTDGVQSDVTAIKTKTDNLPANTAQELTDIDTALTTIDGIVDDILLDTAAIDARLPADPADQSAVEAAISASESAIRGVDNDTLKTLSDQSDAILTEIQNSSNPFRLTTYTTKSGSPVSYVDATWTDIYSSGALSKDTEITGIQIDNSGSLTDPIYRITLGDGTTKVFPYGASDPVRSGKLEEFQFPVRIPSSTTYKVQVNCTSANGRTATLTELDVIEVG